MQFPKAFFTILLLAAAAFAQEPTKWTMSVEPANGPAGTLFKARLTAEIDGGWHLYALDQPAGGPIATTIKVAEGKPFEIAGDIEASAAKTQADPNFIVDGKPLNTKFFSGSASFIVPLRAAIDAAAVDAALDVRFQVCNDTLCLPPKTLRVSTSGTEEVMRTLTGRRASASPTPEMQAQQREPAADDDLAGFIWLAIVLGALSLLTPCVFPMIPITVSYFTNHAAGDKGKAVRIATIYSLGIIATFTLLGMLLAIFVGAAGVNLFAANPWVNLVIAAVFFAFAFNLFGAFEISVPTGLLSRLDAITRTKEGEGSGVVGALLMGLTFTLTSFTCTSPFVGTILVSASQGEWQRPLIGMLAFSTVFALPFFILAIVPQWISQLPRAGGWMNSVKVTMGFLEIAAALKFVSNVDLVWKWGIFTRQIILAAWVAIGVILTLYLLGRFQLSHDSKPERIGAFRLTAAILSLAASFYLLTGLFGAKLGELEAFLPPDLSAYTSSQTGGQKTGPDWIVNDLPAAQAKAKAENKQLFIDFTGYTCTNCRWMEANIFPHKDVAAELNNFVLVKLFTDGDGEIYERHQQLEQQMFGTVALPYYAILDPDGRTAGSFPGLTRNVSEFVDFLRKSKK